LGVRREEEAALTVKEAQELLMEATEVQKGERVRLVAAEPIQMAFAKSAEAVSFLAVEASVLRKYLVMRLKLV
jgi:hypothetical protein